MTRIIEERVSEPHTPVNSWLTGGERLHSEREPDSQPAAQKTFHLFLMLSSSLFYELKPYVQIIKELLETRWLLWVLEDAHLCDPAHANALAFPNFRSVGYADSALIKTDPKSGCF